MKHMIGAVFGHYDSRGGTMFLEMREQTREEFTRVCHEYDDGCFGWSEWSDGMGDDCRPSSNDFMYLARLALQDNFTPIRTGNVADSTLGGMDLEVDGCVVFGLRAEDDAVDAQRDSIEDVPLLELEFIPVPDGRYSISDFAELLALVHELAQTEAGFMCDDVPCWNDDAYGFVVIPVA